MRQRMIREALSSAAQYEARRTFLRKGALAVGGAGLLVAGCTNGDGDAVAGGESGTPAGGGAAPTSGTSLLDRILDGETVRVGADLTFPPLQFKEGDEPAGYTIELALQMLDELGAEVEIVEVPFAELFGALAAGRFDISGIGATILPSRAQQVMFASEPLFIESNVVLRNVDSPVQTAADLNSPDVTIAVLVGSAQEASAEQLFPEATLRSLEQQPAVQDAATGRADVVLLGEFNVAEVLETNSDLEVLEGPPLFADINTYFLPQGDFKMKAYVDNWMRYQIIRGRFASLWETYVGGPAAAAGIQSTPVYSPYLAAGTVFADQRG
ncbi:hypothetical protein BH23ACT7_BH23ACT7_07260 [soil metagenome]